MIDKLEKYLLSSRGKLRKDSDLLKKAFYIYWKLPKTNIQNYIAIFSEEDPLYRTHNSEIGNIMFLACDHVTARYFLIQPCKSGDGFDDHYPTNTHSVNFCGNACTNRPYFCSLP